MFSERARKKPKGENSSAKQIFVSSVYHPALMKPALLVPLLLLSSLLFEAQGIRLSRDLASLADLQRLTEHAVAPSPVKLETDSVGSNKKRVSKASKKSSDGVLPSIHEDYYGPRNHKPRHHKH